MSCIIRSRPRGSQAPLQPNNGVQDAADLFCGLRRSCHTVTAQCLLARLPTSAASYNVLCLQARQCHLGQAHVYLAPYHGRRSWLRQLSWHVTVIIEPANPKIGKYQLTAKHLLATDHSSSTYQNTDYRTPSFFYALHVLPIQTPAKPKEGPAAAGPRVAAEVCRARAGRASAAPGHPSETSQLWKLAPDKRSGPGWGCLEQCRVQAPGQGSPPAPISQLALSALLFHGRQTKSTASAWFQDFSS